jgi:hypothetical protein
LSHFIHAFCLFTSIYKKKHENNLKSCTSTPGKPGKIRSEENGNSREEKCYQSYP